MMMTAQTYFSSDTHFGHAAVIRHAGRPFDSVEEMDEALITAWNETVAPNDEAWLLGDFSFHRRARTAEIFAALHGRKHLIKGNHDPRETQRLPWERVEDLHTWKGEGHRLVLCHYPLLTWNGGHHGVGHLHGHSHGRLRAYPSTRLDVGVDTRPDFRPYHLDEVLDILATRTYNIVDHHAPKEAR